MVRAKIGSKLGPFLAFLAILKGASWFRQVWQVLQRACPGWERDPVINAFHRLIDNQLALAA
jgi:hypothetical protein